MSELATYNKEGPQAGTYTVANLLAANVPESITVPVDQNGLKARYVTFGRGATTDVFFAAPFNATDGADRATGGTFVDLVTNGAFASDTGWTKGTGWTIAAGVATATGAISTSLSQAAAVTLIPGYSYTVTFTTSSTAAGSVAVSLGGGTAGTSRSTDGTFIETIVAGNSDNIIKFTGSGFTGNIDNVTVTPWILGTGWTTTTVATATGAISTALSQTANPRFPLKEGQAYYVTFTATRSAGSVTVNIGGTAGTARSSAATFSELILAGSTQAISFTTSGFTGTIDDVTIIPVVSVPVDASLGVSGPENPTALFLGNNNDASRISIVSAGTPTITTSFYK
jgi:hypothetical protein